MDYDMELPTDQATIMDYAQSVSLPSSGSSTPQVSHCYFPQLCNADIRNSSGIANSDEQKASLLAQTLNNFIENKRPDDKIYPIDDNITNTLEDFLSHPPPFPIAPTNQDEITDYANNKAPGSDITNKMRGRSTGAVFLDIQKVFDRVWGLIYKLITNNFPSALIHLINSYLVNRSFKIKQYPYSSLGENQSHHQPSIPHNYTGLRARSTLRQNFSMETTHLIRARKIPERLALNLPEFLNESLQQSTSLHCCVLRPILTYACPVWGYAANSNIKLLENAQNALIRNITKAVWANWRIVHHMGRSDAAIRRFWQEWVDNGRFQSHDSSGRPRATADREDKLIASSAVTVPDSSLSTISAHECLP
ncbi:HTH_Tnp_Tc3_2 domain-containing protein [Trichonephila clavipes]|nr:HTH_Tnp_Tc3_2 domain-containing protein [Trichonephila clavipes]